MYSASTLSSSLRPSRDLFFWGLIGDEYAIITKLVCLSVLTRLFTELIAL